MYAKGSCMSSQEPGLASRMGDAARSHVEANFSRRVFGQRLVDILMDMNLG